MERLLLAYSSGIFPWYSSETPIIWWSPDPRFVIYPSDVKISKSMKQVLKRGIFDIKFDTSFREVITACSGKRKHEKGTWITSEMIEAYVVLHELGFAHSIEAWRDGKLAGGLYGVSLGGMFFGESMFSRESNASKAAFIVLAGNLLHLGFDLIDSQVHTDHMESMGAIEMDRGFFLDLVKKSVRRDTIRGNWGDNPLFKTEVAL
ncbi:MAG: leucyl/phenylalanyl-tRNA--protein transferase [Spirochaetae bacterium HGW-Spirochaetae-5]|nr:MAG: leucyl/phenylalanyl-tRNA--protein transferase [Spirochaetae bacterium HGW-Spirochaetae-5]